MSTAFGGAPTHGNGPVHDEHLPISEFPAWGMDIMAGLYGPETIRAARDAERRRLSPAIAPAMPHECVAVSPLMLELEAVTEVGRLIERLIRRMVRRPTN